MLQVIDLGLVKWRMQGAVFYAWNDITQYTKMTDGVTNSIKYLVIQRANQYHDYLLHKKTNRCIILSIGLLSKVEPEPFNITYRIFSHVMKSKKITWANNEDQYLDVLDQLLISCYLEYMISKKWRVTNTLLEYVPVTGFHNLSYTLVKIM